MIETRLCDNCGQEFEAEENMVQCRTKDGVFYNDLEWETICPDCRKDLDLEDKTSE